MNGVTFGSKHSINNWNLLLESKTIGEPEPKILTVDIPGSNGQKDLTEAFGEVLYKNRQLVFNFSIFDSSSDWWTLKTEISNYLHGKKMTITLDQDDDYYYYGRCKVTNFSNTTTVAYITIECDCDPFKYKQTLTSSTETVSSGDELKYTNSRMSVIPTLTLSTAMTLSFNNTSYSLQSGEQKVLGIKFTEGTNTIGVTTGSGTLKVEYREGNL